jgi:hypothetical protein
LKNNKGKKALYPLIGLFFVCALSTGLLPAVFASSSLNVSYNAADAEIKIDGVIEENSAPYIGAVSITVAPAGKSRSEFDVTGLTEGSIIVASARSYAGGVFDYPPLIFPDSFESGGYIIYADTANTHLSYTILFYNPVSSAPALEQINAAPSASAVNAVLTNEGANICAAPEVISKYGSSISAMLFSSRPSGGYTLAEFSRRYAEAALLSEVKGGMSLDDAIKAYGVNISMDFEAGYYSYPAVLKSETGRLVKNMSYTHSTFDLFWHECALLAKINTETSDVTVKTLLLSSEASVIGLNMSVYNSISSDYYKNTVFGAMLNRSFNDFSEVRSAFDAAVSDARNKAKNTLSSGGGGVSSGSVASGNIPFIPASTPTPTPMPVFTDLEGHWSRSDVEAMASRGIINGYEDNTFRGDNAVTRAEFVKMAALLFGLPQTLTGEFADVSDSDWFAPYVGAASSAGLVNGYDGIFAPETSITRQDAAVIIYRALKVNNGNLSGNTLFDDSYDIAAYAADPVGVMAANGLINGSDGKFNPRDFATRSETAAILNRVVKFCGI